MAMSAARNRRGLAPAVLAIMAIVGSLWHLAPSFVGQTSARQSTLGHQRTQMQGWRLDRSFEKFLKGENRGDLETIEGFFYGETFWQDFMNKQGLRYYMNPTKDEIAAARAKEIPNQLPFTQGENEYFQLVLGPIKIPLGRMFGCTGNNAKLNDIKRELANKPLEPEKIAENERWMKMYGHKRHEKKYTDQSTGMSTEWLGGGAKADWPTGWKKGKLQGYVGEAPVSEIAAEVASKKKALKER